MSATEAISEGSVENSKEEDDLMGRNIKKMQSRGTLEEGNAVGRMGPIQEDVAMEFLGGKDAPRVSFQKTHNISNQARSQISYKGKLLGEEEKKMDKTFDEQMMEWLNEEQELAPVLTEEQRQAMSAIPSLSLPNEKLKDLCRPWKDALILTVLGKMANLHMMKDRIKWLLRSENFELIDLPNNYYVFRTAEKALCSRLLFDGPWLIQGHYMAVQRWSPNFNPYCNKVRKVAVWIRIPTLPLHMYSEDCMYEIGNLIGRTLKVDMNTLAHQGGNKQAVERGKYARVSVEVDLNKKLQSRFLLRNHIYPVEYEGLSAICFSCRLYGHTSQTCKLKMISADATVKQNNQEGTPMTVDDGEEDRKLPLVSVPGVNVEEEYGT